MTNPDEYYPVNTLPALAWALNLYFKKGAPFKESRIIEMILPADKHKEKLKTKAVHEIAVWIADKQVYARARCPYDKKCSFNSERILAKNREELKSLPWDKIDQTKYYPILRKWLLALDFDYITLIRALAVVCDKKVQLPLETKYGRTFKKFNEYRSYRFPEDAKPDNMPRFLEEVLVRVGFWIQSAAEVDALK
ncbi:MAG: hypothetical protein BAJATHORv1_50204 [Candidatus Thorarchaeota archaeon]|nr:MAG: hypothetical protein BAJATHORv1_50204 [Candidatus Thorarchaeota archaeon]